MALPALRINQARAFSKSRFCFRSCSCLRLGSSKWDAMPTSACWSGMRSAGAAYGAQGLAQSVDTAGITAAATNDFQSNGYSGLQLTPAPSDTCQCDSLGTLTSPVSCTGSSAGTCASGHWIVTLNVTASGTFNSMFQYPGIPRSITLSSSAKMRVTQ